jgi:hypothetical protein
MQNHAIIPECETEKKQNIAAEVAKQGHIENSQPSQPSTNALPTPPHPSQEQAQRADDAAALQQVDDAAALAAAKKKFEWWVHSFDGAHSFLEAAVRIVSQRYKRLGIKCIEQKLPAGASFIRSMNDAAAHMHSCIHAYYSSSSFKYQQFHPMPHGALWVSFMADLRKLCLPADFHSASEAFKHVPTVLSKACTRQNIMGAAFQTGVLSAEGLQRCEEGTSTDPSNFLKILSAHPHWKTIPTEIAEKVRDICHPKFVEITGRRGFVLEGEQL